MDDTKKIRRHLQDRYSFSGDTVLECPHPDCNHTGYCITYVHAEKVHNMTKEDLFHYYGKPQPRNKITASNSYNITSSEEYGRYLRGEKYDKTKIKKIVQREVMN